MKKKSNSILISLAFILTFLIVLISTIKKFTFASNLEFDSKIYSISNNTITNISPNTSINLYKKYFDINNGYLKIINENNEEITSGNVYTGTKTLVYNTSNALSGTYTNIITGDITKDGIINSDDINKIQRYLNNEITLTEIELKAADINKDNNVTTEDTSRLNELINSSYQSLQLNKSEITLVTNEKERIIPTISPNIILNQNLNWTSSNTGIATVDETGVITALTQGEATITATTKDNSISKTVRVIVDNRPKLALTTLETYTGAYDTEIPISALNYNELTCSVDNEEIVNCDIDNKKLIIHPLDSGNTTVRVISPTYGEATITVEVLFASFTMFPKEACVETNLNVGSGVIVSGFNFGNISTKSISDREILRNATLNRRSLALETGNKPGDASVVFTESNGHNEVRFTAKVFKLSLSASTGTTPLNGKKLVVKITSGNTGDLSCTSNDTRVATCKIEGEYLTVTQVSEGSTTIRVVGQKCGTVTYNATITRSLDEDNYLKNLSVDDETIKPNFKKETQDYTLITGKEKITIKATKNNELQTLEGDIGNRSIDYGLNIFKIKVTSELGEERIYTLSVTKPLPKEQPKNNNTNNNNGAEDVGLNDIQIDDYKIDFNKNTFKYEIEVNGFTEELDISAIPTSKDSKVEIDKPNTLKVGENIITITITGKNGKKCKYVVIANKKKLSNDTLIKEISIKGYELNYQKDKYTYDLPIKNDRKLDITVLLNDPKSTYKITGNEKLKNNSIITITVTSEAKTTQDYTINILKDQYSNSPVINNIPLAINISLLIILTSLITLTRKRITKK